MAAPPPEFPVLEPDRQISMYARLQAMPERYLTEALKETVEQEDFDLPTVDRELSIYADAGSLKRIASFGLRGEVFFPVPYVLKRNPFLLGYYRLLVGFSRKAFYEQGPFKRFDRLQTQAKSGLTWRNMSRASVEAFVRVRSCSSNRSIPSVRPL